MAENHPTTISQTFARMPGTGNQARHRWDLRGHRFGRLTAIELAVTSGQSQWRCTCECGTEKTVRASQLLNGKTQSCGCLHSEIFAAISRKRLMTHGMTNSREFGIWRGMIRRCEDPRTHAYPKYGAVGVTVCEQWHKFENFFADMGPIPEGRRTLDRIDGTKGYEPGNCRWATWKEQLRNRPRYNHMITHNGETLCAAEWAERYGLDPVKFRGRLRRGWSFESAICA